MYFFFFFICLVSLLDATIFDGRWRLEPRKDIGSCREVLGLIGVSTINIPTMCSLTVTETMALSFEALHLIRITRYSRTDQYFHWSEEEEIDDLVLGRVTQTINILDARHIKTVCRRHDDNGIFIGSRKILSGDDNCLIYTMNYTTQTGLHASVVRYYYRQ